MSDPRSIPASWYRGGTSKCWIFRADDLPADPTERDHLLVRLFGSPDAKQIDGVGGATSVTSKALVVSGLAEGDPTTVEYAFAQVSLDREIVEWDSNCGNCATGLALWAVQHMVPPAGERTDVGLRNTITGLELATVVDTPGGGVPSPGGTTIPGTVYPGPSVSLKFDRASWSSYGETLPTGHAQDPLVAGALRSSATLVDAGAPAAFVLASDLGMTAQESPAEFDARIEDFFALRAAARTAMGLDRLGPDGQSVPKIGIVGPAQPGDDVDLHARMVSMTAVHPAIGITSAIAVAAAAGVPGSTVDQVIAAKGADVLRIGTLAGAITLEIGRDAGGEPDWAMLRRSARRLAEATLYVP